MKPKTVILIPILLAIFYGTGCSRSGSAKTTDSQRIIPVRVAEVQYANIERTIAYLGNLEAFKEVRVYSTIPTRIVELKAEVNDYVSEGDLLAVVDNVKIKQGVIQAEAGLQSAQAQYENLLTEWKRLKKLFDEKAVSQSQFDAVNAQKEAAEAMVNQMKAGLKSVKEQLNDSFIKAPIAGIIAMRSYNIGDQTTPQLPAFSIVQMDKIKIIIDIVESQVAQIRAGQKTYITVDTWPNQVFTGRVDKIYPTINPLTRTLKCEIVIDNPDLKLKPGGFARVEIVVDRHPNTLVIPKYAVIEKNSLEYLGGKVTHTRVRTDRYVFVVEDDIVRLRDIQTDIISGNQVEVIAGLKAGELIVTIGQHDISDSSRVEIVERGV